jgi:nucleoside-diphosphate-sugar epimerase
MLLQRGDEITVVDKLMFGCSGMLGPFAYSNFKFVRGDIANEDLMKTYLQDKDLVVHLAAYVGYPICKKYPDEATRTNLHGSLLINKLRGQMPILFGSTGSNYGAVIDKICTEETPLNPITLYAETKTLAERAFHESGNSICYRFATAFGVSPRLRLDLLVNDFCYRAAKLRSLIVYEANFKRTFIHVRDIAHSFVFAIDNYQRMKNQVFNVGSNKMNYTKADIARKIKEKIDYYLHFADVGKDEDQRNYEVSYEKIESLGFTTTTSLEKGIDELLGLVEAVDISNPYSNV